VDKEGENPAARQDSVNVRNFEGRILRQGRRHGKTLLYCARGGVEGGETLQSSRLKNHGRIKTPIALVQVFITDSGCQKMQARLGEQVYLLQKGQRERAYSFRNLSYQKNLFPFILSRCHGLTFNSASAEWRRRADAAGHRRPVSRTTVPKTSSRGSSSCSFKTNLVKNLRLTWCRATSEGAIIDAPIALSCACSETRA
jgi:hypothetical protein